VELKYDSFIPNKVQMKYAKYMLGVHKSATNITVLAELGLYPLSIAALKSSVIYWIRLLNSKCNSLIFQVNSDQTSLQYKRIGCTQALKSLIHVCPYMFILSDNKDFCMQNIALHAFLIADRLHMEKNQMV
jgi:hypothetical protein